MMSEIIATFTDQRLILMYIIVGAAMIVAHIVKKGHVPDSEYRKHPWRYR